MSAYHCICVDEAEDLIRDTNVMILDMRDVRAFMAGHHPRAIHLNDSNLRHLLKSLSRNIPVLIYCYHGHSSQDMSQLFSDFGFTNVYSLDGGYEAWFQRITLPVVSLGDELTKWMEARHYDPENLDKRGNNNDTALIRAAREGEFEKCRELIKAGASVNLVNKDGNNALWMACFAENKAIFDLLIEQGVEIDNQNDNGATALIYTASAGKTEMVKALLDAGADATLMTLDDFTALEVAANKEIFKMLRSLVVVKGNTLAQTANV